MVTVAYCLMKSLALCYLLKRSRICTGVLRKSCGRNWRGLTDVVMNGSMSAVFFPFLVPNLVFLLLHDMELITKKRYEKLMIKFKTFSCQRFSKVLIVSYWVGLCEKGIGQIISEPKYICVSSVECSWLGRYNDLDSRMIFALVVVVAVLEFMKIRYQYRYLFFSSLKLWVW